MSIKIFVSADSSALSVGADHVAAAIEAHAERLAISVTITRTGSRGLFYLEPLVEVEFNGTRLGFGPLTTADVARLFDLGFPNCLDNPEVAKDPCALGPVEEIDYLKRQTRLTFQRCGIVDPRSVHDYVRHGGYEGLTRAVALGADGIIDEIKRSGLRGRGGAGFPTGIKWKTVREAAGHEKYLVCNADEGDSGTFADRLLLEGDPFLLIEGMTIAGFAVGATKGVIYIRSEYPHAIATFGHAIAAARAAGYLGTHVMAHGFSFDIDLRVGAGAYICGEETAMLESIEGRRGTVRAKPPLPAIKGLFGKPTAINNVLSLAAVPWILAHGAEAYATCGLGRSRGTQPLQLAGNVKRGGLVEVAFGISLRKVIHDFGGGTLSGRPVRAVQVGGPLGAYFPDALLDTPVDYEAMAAAGGMLGHGGIVVFDDRVNLMAQARFALEFCALESCGKCTPCRIGSTRGVELVDAVALGRNVDANIALLEELCGVLTDASLCALGGLTPLPVRSALRHFPDDFGPAPHLRRAAE
jgi:formate dehydrogenase iron-sulfur subunit